jgi:hypothetical protein
MHKDSILSSFDPINPYAIIFSENGKMDHVFSVNISEGTCVFWKTDGDGAPLYDAHGAAICEKADVSILRLSRSAPEFVRSEFLYRLENEWKNSPIKFQS